MERNRLYDDLPSESEIGGKARSLLILRKEGFNVPYLFAIPVKKVSLHKIDKLKEEIESIIEGRPAKFIIRSSAFGEDSKENSYAGLFESARINNKDEIMSALKKVISSTKSEKLKQYIKSKKIKNKPKLAIFVQEFVEGEVSGVLFSSQSKFYIASDYGFAEPIVKGAVCDEYILNRDSGVIVRKNIKENSLNSKKITLLVNTVKRMEGLLGAGLDVEWTIKGSKIYILQCRPITSPIEERNSLIVWDNSNIAESYSGTVLPLTCSFTEMVYSGVYQKVALESGVSEKMVKEYERYFDNMLGFFYGRVYYNILNWYKILTLFPGYNLNKSNLDLMISAKSKAQLDKKFRENVGPLFKLKYYLLVLHKYSKFKKTLNYFRVKTKRIIQDYSNKDYGQFSLDEMYEEFKKFKDNLIPIWYIPIENDFLVMTFFGLSNKFADRTGISKNVILKELADIKNLQSYNQIKEILKISNEVKKDKKLTSCLKQERYQEALEIIKQDKNISSMISCYFSEYGGRFVNELKLESEELTPHSEDFLSLIRLYLDYKPRKMFDKKLNLPLLLRYFLAKAKYHIQQREELRILRAQAFSITRRIFLGIGELLEERKAISSKRDVFYLKIKEIYEYIKSSNVDLKKIVLKRKLEYGIYKNKTLPSVFYTKSSGEIVVPPMNVELEKGKELSGRPCSSGEVSGRVNLIKCSKPKIGKKYDIIITESADPGWAPIIAKCRGIIIEKGGILSHISILARELGIPCIINAQNITSLVKDNEKIYMNGENGKIKLLGD